jgi:hypothetical protein
MHDRQVTFQMFLQVQPGERVVDLRTAGAGKMQGPLAHRFVLDCWRQLTSLDSTSRINCYCEIQD